MTLPLDIGEQLIDRSKSSLYLYYLARATHRVMQREIAHKKVELAIKQLKKLSTKDLHKHVDELRQNIIEAIHSEKQILTHQKGEESVHGELSHKIGKLEKKLGRYLETQEARKERVEELENKIKQKFTSKQELLRQLRNDMKRLTKLYNTARKSKNYSKSQLLNISQRIAHFKDRILLLK